MKPSVSLTIQREEIINPQSVGRTGLCEETRPADFNSRQHDSFSEALRLYIMIEGEPRRQDISPTEDMV